MMDELPTSAPTALLRTVAVVARWALWLLVAFWVVLAMVWGGLHFVIVPRISELRPWVEQQASSAVGIPVRIGGVAAQSNGLIPSIEFTQVQLLDAQGRVALLLPSVQVALSPRSVLGGGLEQLYIDRPELDVRRTADGRLWVAGLALTGGPSADSPALDWVFSQFELAIRHGTVTWTDEMRAAPALTLTDLDWVLRNRHHTHSVRLDATPPAGWGERFTLEGMFKQPLLSTHAGNWSRWKGQLYANFTQVDLAQLRSYVDVGVDVSAGSGPLRAWVDVDRGAPTAATVDLALSDVRARIDQQQGALAFRWVAGRLGARQFDGGYEVSTQALEFDTADGLHWPGGNLRLGMFKGDARSGPHGDLEADRLDLAAMAEIASRLPLGQEARTALARLAPKGLVQRLHATWDGTLEVPSHYAVQGRVEKLDIAAQAGGARPGFKGVDIDFDLNQSGGKASVAVQGGAVQAPAQFEDPVIALEHLAAQVQWKVDGEHISLSMPSVRFGNADAQGEFQLNWERSAAQAGGAAAKGHSELGVIDLQGSLSKAALNRVYRYLPLGIGKSVRDYVRDAVLTGEGTGVKFKVKGNLRDFPYTDGRSGEFRVTANLHNASYAYVPTNILPKDSLPWPTLTQMDAEFSIDHAGLQIKGGHSAVANAGALRMTQIDGLVSNLYEAAQVTVTAEVRGPLADALGMVKTSPLAALTGRALSAATGAGNAEYRFKLGLPIAAPERAVVQGSVVLTGNEVQITPDSPLLSRARGTVLFSESGFSVAGVQARALGGDVRLDGGLSTQVGPSTSGAAGAKMPTVLRFQGVASSDGLRQAKELGFFSRLGQYASGATAFTGTLGLRGKVLEIKVGSTLTGLALSLPPPFAKSADAALPIRFETTALPAQGATLLDRMEVDVGGIANMVYLRDVSGAEPRVLRGAMGVGLAADESAPLPDSGVVANVNVGKVDLDAWAQVLSHSSGTGLSARSLTTASNVAAMSYLPTSMVIRAQELLVEGRRINNVLLGGGRDGLLWRANLDATEFNGYIEYRQSLGPTAGRLYARLARLSIAATTAQDVENILDEQPTSIPALDIVVEDFELRGKKLGRIEIEAVNLGAQATREAAREWRLNRFNISTPEATLTASGNWTNINSMSAPGSARSIKDRRRTVMNFSLDIGDAGELLKRFGMVDVVRKGKGKIEGQVAWLGSPFTLDYPSFNGKFNVNVETGQFLKTDPGIARLLGVLSLQSLPRRLALDFRDVFSEGFAFDFLRGDVNIEQGIARTNNLQMKGVSAAVLMEGQADIAKETQSIKVLVIPEINAGSASLIYSAINPLVGLTTFLANVILRRPLIEANTQEFLVDGSWVDPQVTKVERRSPNEAGTKPAKPEESK